MQLTERIFLKVLLLTSLCSWPLVAAPTNDLHFDAAKVEAFSAQNENYKVTADLGKVPGPWTVGSWAKGAKAAASIANDPIENKPALRLVNLEGQPSLMWKRWKEASVEGGEWRASIEYLKTGAKAAKLVATINGKDVSVALPPSTTWQTANLPLSATRQRNNALNLTVQHYQGSGPDEALWVRRIALEKIAELPPPVPFVVDVSKVSGARVDESVIQRTLEVGATQQYKTLRSAWDAAMPLLRDGVATRIRLHPGTYREGELEMDARKVGGKAAETLFIIEAATPGMVIISGSDVYAPAEWKAVRGEKGEVLYYEHEWKHDFGFKPGGWNRHNPKLTIEHRRELAFLNGAPLKQVELEIYKHTPVIPDPKDGWKTLPFPEGTKTDAFVGVPQDIKGKGLYEYLRFADPKTMPPGSFAIAEREENGNRIFVRPPLGVDWSKANVEVGVRQFHLWSFYKSNLVLRGLTFQHSIGEIEARGAVLVGHWLHTQKEFSNNNVLVEDCNFRWNNNNQLVLRYAKDITVRRNKMLYGAYGGALTGVINNLLWEDNETSFNNWRVEGGWSSGPLKVHETVDAIFRRHTSIGNFGTGMWYDVTCSNVLIEDPTILENAAGFDWEISRGVLFRRGLVANNRGSAMWIPTGMDITIEDSIFYGPKSDALISFEASRRSSGQKVNEMLERQTVESYHLGPMTMRNSVAVSSGDAHLFFQRHGAPDSYQEFFKERLTLQNNLWHAPRTEAFGTGKIYDADFRNKPIRNTLVSWDKWRELTKATGTWADPGFRDPQNYDFTLRPDSPLQGRNLPSRKIADDKVRQLRDFMALGLHVKENPQKVADVVGD